MIPDKRSRQALSQYKIDNFSVSNMGDCGPCLVSRCKTLPEAGDRPFTVAGCVAVWLNWEKGLPAELSLGDLANGAELNLPNNIRRNFHPRGYSYMAGEAPASYQYERYKAYHFLKLKSHELKVPVDAFARDRHESKDFVNSHLWPLKPQELITKGGDGTASSLQIRAHAAHHQSRNMSAS